MIITDLDGTLLNSQSQVSERNLRTLQRLGQEAVPRIIATGRSLYSARKVLKNDFPIDYLVFSSGNGIWDWSEQKLIYSCDFTLRETHELTRFLYSKKLPLMVLDACPENHRMTYWQNDSAPADYFRRLERYRDFARPWDEKLDSLSAASQFIVIPDESQAMNVLADLREGLPQWNVIRATSPLDGVSSWIEIFHPNASKAYAGKWLAEKLNIAWSTVVAIGNDYNDLPMLEASEHAYCVGNAPGELLNRFRVVASHDEDGFTEAAEMHWRD